MVAFVVNFTVPGMFKHYISLQNTVCTQFNDRWLKLRPV
jgi:hypothetical protein